MPARPIRQNKSPWSDAEREVLRTTPIDKDAERILRQQCGQERARSSIRLERHRMEVESLRAALAEAATALPQAVRDERNRCALIARNGCLVPPDGGSPTEAERLLCEEIERRIRAEAA